MGDQDGAALRGSAGAEDEGWLGVHAAGGDGKSCIWQRSSRVRTPARHQSSPSRETRRPSRSSQRPTVSSSTKRPPMRTSTVCTWVCRLKRCCRCSSGDAGPSTPAHHRALAALLRPHLCAHPEVPGTPAAHTARPAPCWSGTDPCPPPSGGGRPDSSLSHVSLFASPETWWSPSPHSHCPPWSQLPSACQLSPHRALRFGSFFLVLDF